MGGAFARAGRCRQQGGRHRCLGARCGARPPCLLAWIHPPACTRPAPPTPHCLQVLCSDQIPAGSERSLAGATLKRMAHFLRFAYDPAEVGGWECVSGWG